MSAETMFKEFKEHTVSEFFRKNAAMLGYTGKIRSLTTVIHEGVTNSIDAAEDFGVLPDVFVKIKPLSGADHYQVVIEDNASGIPKQFIPKVFGKMLAGTKLHRSVQSRGQQGIGISGCVMFSQITSGKPTKVLTSTGNGKITRTEVMIDVNRNAGKITASDTLNGDWRGTRVEFNVKDVTYQRSRYGPFNYLRMTAIANPHVRITLIEPDGTLTVFERATDEIPKKPKPMPLHPWGVLADDLLFLSKKSKSATVASFLVGSISRVSGSKLGDIPLLLFKIPNVVGEKSQHETLIHHLDKLGYGDLVKRISGASYSLGDTGDVKISSASKEIARITVEGGRCYLQPRRGKAIDLGTVKNTSDGTEVYSDYPFMIFSIPEIGEDKAQQKRLYKHMQNFGATELTKRLKQARYSVKEKDKVKVTFRGKFAASIVVDKHWCYLRPKGGSPIKIGMVKKKRGRREVYVNYTLYDLTKVNLNKPPFDLTWSDAEKIVSAFKRIKFMAPPTRGLQPIGAENIKKGMRQIINPEFVHAVTRPPKVYKGGVPFVVEVGVAYGGNAGKQAEDSEGLELIRFANRSPLVFDQGGCAITSAAKNVDWRRYAVDTGNTPVTVFVNVISTHVPYTSAGKQSIAEESEVYEEIRSAIMKASHELRRFLQHKVRTAERRQRAGIFERYLPIIARRAASLSGKKEPNIEKLMKKVAGTPKEEEEKLEEEEATGELTEEMEEEVEENGEQQE